MYKVNEELYINLDYVSEIYFSKRNNGWRLAMVGAADCDEFQITDIEAKNILKAIDIHQAILKK